MQKITGKDLLENSKVEFIYEHPVTHYSVWAGIEYHADSFKENFTFLLLDADGRISEKKDIGKDAAIKLGYKAITNVFKDCVGGLNETNAIEEIAQKIKERHSRINRVNVSGNDDAVTVYCRLFEEAELNKQEYKDRLFIDKEGCCNILASEFKEIIEELDLSCNRLKFLDTMRMLGLLDSNNGRNEKKVSSSELRDDGKGHKQIRVIRLKPFQRNETARVKNKETVTDNEGAKYSLQSATDKLSKTVFFPYFGGKNNMAGDIIQELIPNDIEEYHELFGGSGAILLNLRNRPSLVHINDMDKRIYTLYKVMADTEKSMQLIDKMEAVEYSKLEFNSALEKMQNDKEANDIDIAYNEYIIITQSFNNLRKYFAKDKVETDEYRIRTIRNLIKVRDKLQGVIITNNDALDEIKAILNNPCAFAYLDPPYDYELMNSKDDYRHNMDEQRQIEFLSLIQKAKCKLLVSGYRSENWNGLYDKWLNKDNGWYCVCIADMHKASSGKVGARAKEWVWYNYELPEDAKYFVTTVE